MRNLQIILLLIFSIPFALQAQLRQLKPAFEHLTELNEQWKQHADFAPKQEMAFYKDADRIAFHLDLVVKYLSNNAPENLKSETLQKRQELLSQLKKYAEGRAFPINSYHPIRTPYFIDDFDNFCAVGYLMKASGHEALARKIQASSNYEYLKNISVKGIKAWAAQHGFTLDELKWIQPNYGPNGYTLPLGEPINGPVTAFCQDSNYLYIAGDFDSLGNKASNGFLKYNGESLQLWDLPFSGKVNAMQKIGNMLYIGGKISFNGQYALVCYNMESGAIETNSIKDFTEEFDEVYRMAFNSSGDSLRVAVRSKLDSSKFRIYHICDSLSSITHELSITGSITGGVTDMVYTGFVGPVKSVDVHKDGEMLRLPPGEFYSFENQAWTRPPKEKNSYFFDSYRLIESLGDSFVLINDYDINAWSYRKGDSLRSPKRTFSQAKGIPKASYLSENELHLVGELEQVSFMHENSNYCSARLPSFDENSIGSFSKGSMTAVSVFKEQVIVGGPFFTEGYRIVNEYATNGKQWPVRYLGRISALPSGIKGHDKNSVRDFYLYPNPAKKTMVVGFAGKNRKLSDIVISNLHGQEISVEFIRLENNQYQLDLSHLPTGNFVLKMVFENSAALHSYFLKE